MLDHTKLAAQILKLSAKLFPDLRDQNDLAQKKWEQIANDPTFISRVEAAKSSFLIPEWMGNLNDVYKIKKDLKTYSVLAVDGSQIYPDRHMLGANCFLINVGGCKFDYGKSSSVHFFSEPKVFLPEDLILNNNDEFQFSIDLVDLKREELELEVAFEKALFCKPSICLFDGSLIFWYLDGKQPEVKDLFLKKYISYLNQFYQNQILVAGFISFPKSRELVNLIKLGFCRFTVADCISCHSQYNTFPCKVVDNLLDSFVARFFLNPGERTTIFWSKSKIVQEYPDPLKPCFFYLHADKEIVRIEIPTWIAQNSEHLDLICSIAYDQCQKGQGYPVCLAESHEQAVVKSPDRDFFYYLIQKVGIEQKRQFFASQKSIKKRGIGV